jgi:hypothetical protein
MDACASPSRAKTKRGQRQTQLHVKRRARTAPRARSRTARAVSAPSKGRYQASSLAELAEAADVRFKISKKSLCLAIDAARAHQNDLQVALLGEAPRGVLEQERHRDG